MKNFSITKKFTKDFKGNKVLVITIDQKLNKNKWKNRYLLFNEETAAYKYNLNVLKQKQKGQKND